MATIIPNSEVRLIKNVPFSNNYKNVIQFNDKTSQENYFKSLPNILADDFKYVRNNGIIKVPYYRDEILEYNYLMFKNKAYGDKYFYAFITNISYINPNTSAISFELDVFQTWFMDVQFKPSYIEREHCQRWNSDGTPVINTIPEGLDYGSEYVYKGHTRLYDKTNNNKIKWLVIASTIDEEDLIGEYPEFQYCFSSQALCNNIVFIVAPMFEYGVADNWTLNGTSLPSATEILRAFRYGSNLVKKAVSCYVTDYLPCWYTVTSVSGKLAVSSQEINIYKAEYGREVNGNITNIISIDLPILSIPSNDDIQNETWSFELIDDKYKYLKNGITESKLLMYPYSYNLLTDLQGDEFIIKNEYNQGKNIAVDIRCALGVSNNVAYTIHGYLNSNGIGNELYLRNGIINKNTNRLAIVDDYAAAYAQGNMNTIEQNINATKQQTSLNNRIAQNTANTNTAVTDTRNRANMLNAGIGAVGGTIEGAILGGPLALAGAVQGLSNAAQTTVSNMANSRVTELENQNMLNNTALRGELANQQAVAGAMAKVQDAKATADNVTLQGGDTYFNYGYENLGVKLISYQITQEYIDLLQDYFGKYGYKVHKVKIPNIHTRQNWNYIQTVGANIVGNIPQMFIDALEQLFNQGITIWHTTDVGNYNLPNNEI